MIRERLDWWIEKSILGLVLIILIFAPLAMGATRPRDFLVIQWLTLPLVILWIARLWISPAFRLYWPPVCWAVLAFVAYAVGRYLTAELEYVARQELMRVLTYALLFLVLTQNLRSPSAIQIVGLVVVVLATLIAAYAIYQYTTNSDRVWHFVRPALYAKRGSGTYICPNHLAGYLEMILPLALCYALIGRFKPQTRILLGYAALVIFGGLLVTVSRGGWVAAGLSLTGLSAWLVARRNYRLRGLVLFAILAFGALGFLAKARLSHGRVLVLQGPNRTEDVRFLLWQPAWRMWLDHFWWGVGPAHFDYFFPQYRPPHRDLQTRPVRVHNDYLNTLVDWGLVGGLLVLSAWFFCVQQVVACRKKVQLLQDNPVYWKSNPSPFCLGAALGLVAILAHSAVDFNMHIPANAIQAIAFMALATGFLGHARQGGWMVSWRLSRWAAALVVLGILVFAARHTWVRTKEILWLVRADGLGRCSTAQIKALERAARAEPANAEIPHRIGVCYQARSWEGFENYRELARRAITWYEQSSRLNPLDPYNYARHGMCLDWIGESEKAEALFERAHELDPNGYYITALVGWHYLNAEDYAESKKWLERSIELYSAHNFMARFYLQHVKRKLAEPKLRR